MCEILTAKNQRLAKRLREQEQMNNDWIQITEESIDAIKEYHTITDDMMCSQQDGLWEMRKIFKKDE